jgi:DMSO/TMAO reductase YedYZ heme-binding membrane subunit
VEFIRSLAYGHSLGPFPVVVWVGLATYAMFLCAATLVSLKRWSAALRRVPVKVHRRLAIVALALATAHLILALSIYI